MALGGGTWTVENKTLPGTYINFVSADLSSIALSDRGVAAMPLILNWGDEGKVVTVTADDFKNNCESIFGYRYDSDAMMVLRDLFRNIRTLYFYKLNTGVKAANTFATAKYGGTRGNDIKIVVSTNVDDSSKFDVKTLVGNSADGYATMDIQAGVSSASELEDNNWVNWIDAATLAVTAGTALTGGTNGSAVTGADWTTAMGKFEAYAFNAFGAVSTDSTIKSYVAAWTKRMRDQIGRKFQTVLYQYPDADYEGIVSVENKLEGETQETASLVYWVTGVIAGCAVNGSNTNKAYDGEYTPDTDYTQSELETALKAGKFIFHRVGDEIRVLKDINTLVTLSDTKGELFRANKTIRIIDQIANDTATLFNTKYIGKIANNDSGRISFWNDLVNLHQDLADIQAIESFDSANITVTAGTEKEAVVVNDVVTIVGTMEQLYMAVTIS